MRTIVCASLLLAPVTALAEPPVDDGGAATTGHAPIVNRLNLRIGGASTDTNGRPTICLDVKLAYRVGVETCGTGQAVLHDEPGAEMAHFRATYSIADRSLWRGTLHARGGLGFAEMQVGIDHPGFRFGDPDADRGSVAGPEASLSAQWLLPLYRGLDVVVTGTAGVAYFAGADALVATKSDVQSFLSIEAGVGW